MDAYQVLVINLRGIFPVRPHEQREPHAYFNNSHTGVQRVVFVDKTNRLSLFLHKIACRHTQHKKKMNKKYQQILFVFFLFLFISGVVMN